MAQVSGDIHEFIDLIYAAAMDPDQWPALLSGVAELVYNEKLDHAKPVDASILAPPLNPTDELDAPVLSKALQTLGGNLQEPISDTSDTTTLNQALSRHFIRALNVAKRLSELEQHNQAICSLLDQLPIALILVNANAEVIEHNRQAERLLNDATPLFIKDGKLCTECGNQNKTLTHSIGNLASQRTDTEHQATLILNADSYQNDLILAFSPLWQPHTNVSPTIAVFVSQRKSQQMKLPESITSLYGLTEKETKVTEHLIYGSSLAEIASLHKVSEHTVRTQLKSVFAKTNTHKQTELVSLILTGPGSFLKTAADQSGQLSTTHYQQGTHYVTLSDGRTLAYNEYGSPTGIPLIYFHSALGSRLEVAIRAHEICVEHNIRLIQPDRPGFGESSPKDEHHFTNWTQDVVELADHLALEKFNLCGYVMGGIFAVACAAEIPERINHLTLISCGEALKTKADFAHTTPLYRMTLKLARDLPSVYYKMASLARVSIFNNITPFFTMLTSKIGSSDSDTTEKPAFKQIFHSALLECGRQGADAHARELNILMKPWNIDVNNVNVPCDIWHGVNDIHVPISTSRRLAQKLPNVTEHHLDDEGHYLFYRHWSDILAPIIQHNQLNI